MPRFSLADLTTIKRDPDPTLVDIINSAPAGAPPLLNNASVRRYTDAIKAAGDIQLAENPDRGRVRSDDPTLDAILEKQHRLTLIDNQLLDAGVRAFDEAERSTGADLARGTVQGLTMALAIDPGNKVLQERLATAQKNLDTATKSIPTVRDDLLRKNSVDLLKQKSSLEKELVLLERLRTEGQTLEGQTIGIADTLAKLTGDNTVESRQRLAEGSYSNELVALGSALDSNIILNASDPLVQANETTRQAFAKYATRISASEHEKEILTNAAEIYSLINVKRNEVIKDPEILARVSRGEDQEDIVNMKLRSKVQEMKRERLATVLAKNPNWFLPADISEDDLRQIAEPILARMSARGTSPNGINNFVSAVGAYLESARFDRTVGDPQQLLTDVNNMVDRMTATAMRRYNATHHPLGFSMSDVTLKQALTPILAAAVGASPARAAGTRGTVGESEAALERGLGALGSLGERFTRARTTGTANQE